MCVLYNGIFYWLDSIVIVIISSLQPFFLSSFSWFSPSMSLLNNSCDPNCVIVFEGPQLHLRSIQEIQIGEEVIIN